MARLIEPGAGGGPVNDGERRVIAFLRERLPDGYTIMPNREIAEPGGQSFDYDAIIVAPHAVYALEIKDWRGRILGDEREWLVNDDTRPSPLVATQRKARVLNSKLTAHTPALGRIWVEAVVVMASEPEELELTPEVARRVFRLNALAGFLTDPAGVGQRPEAIKNLSGHVVRALTERLRGRAGPLVFGSYEVVETIEQGDEETWYRARHRLMPKLPPVRLRVVTLSSYNLTPQQRSERLNTVRREAEACFRMGSHPNIVAVREMFDDPHAPGRLVLVLDDTHGRTLRRRLLDGTPMTLQERLDLLVDLCRALAHAHAHGVIHRQVEPRSILIDDDGTARLTRFGLSKFLEGGEATVWLEDVRADLDLRYLAPELLLPGLGDPTPATDLYELGCIAYELFTGKPPFDSPQQALAGPRPSPDGIPPELIEMLSRLLAGEPGQRPQSAKDVLAVLQGLSDTDASRPVTGAKDRYDSGDLIDGKFEVRQPLGTGGFSSVYRVYWAIEDREYALKVFSATAAYDKVKREIELLRGIDHPRIVHAVWADQTRAGQWYLVTELLRGEPLTAYAEGEKRLSVQEAITYTCQLLSALEAIHPNARRIAELKATGNLTMEEYTELQELEAQGIVHRDIKPQNLMLTDRGIVLIDFNIASRVGQPIMTLSGTPPYQAPDIMAASFAAWDVSPDLFATGVVLYELLCNEHPYESSQPRVDLRPRDPRSFRPELSAELAGFLLKACAPFRDQRFATAREMRVALEGIEFPIVLPHSVGTQGLARSLADLIERHPPNVNPMVREFLALSSQARRSNSGTRGIDDLSLQTYVSTRLDAELGGPVLAGRHRLVIVTGNAGDGKTAFIQKVEMDACRAGAVELQHSLNGRRLAYAGREIVTLYDGSQDEAERASDDLLMEFLMPFRAGEPDDRTIRLAAINEGRLRDFLIGHRNQYPNLAADVIAMLDSAQTPISNSGITVVNLNLRSVTAAERESIFSRQVEKIVGGPFWGPCEECAYRGRCPIKHNVDTFRDSASGPAVTERLRTLVDLVRLRRRRHLTVRDVRSLIAHILFRDRACEEIPELLASDDPFAVVDVAYFQGPGGMGVPDGSTLERGAELLAEIDVALVANPDDDRAIATGDGPRRMSFVDRDSDYLAELLRIARNRAGTGYESDIPQARRTHEALRRQSYFERADDGWRSMLPYQRLSEFKRALQPANEGSRAQLRAQLIKALSIREGMRDSKQAEVALWLATTDTPMPDYGCYRRYAIEQFELRVALAETPYVESEPDQLELVHLPSLAALSINIDLLEVLEHLGEGYMPSLDERSGFLVNLALFRHRLLAEPTTELMLQAENGLLRIAPGALPGSVALSEVHG